MILIVWKEWGFRGGTMVKNLPTSAGDTGDTGLILASGRSPGIGSGNPHQCSCLENSMDKGAWGATVSGVSKSWTHVSTEHICTMERIEFMKTLGHK